MTDPHALRGIPPERVQLKDIADVRFNIKAARFRERRITGERAAGAALVVDDIVAHFMAFSASASRVNP